MFRNDLKHNNNTHYLQVLVLDKEGYYTKQGAEVRVYSSKTKKLLASRIIDTGGGYVSQNVTPIHFGLGSVDLVDIKITYMSKQGRKTKYINNINLKIQKSFITLTI